MTEAWLRLVQLAGLFLALFAVAEWLYKKRHVPAESTRKIVHAGTGLLTLLFPLWLFWWWQAALLCGSFLALLLLSKRFHFLNSIHGVKRETHGSILYPVIVAAAFFFYLYSINHFNSFQSRYYFYLPVLVMAVCDPAAALAGRWHQKNKSFTSGKTAAGSVAFFVTALVITLIFIEVFKLRAIPSLHYLFLLLCLSFSATGAEYISKKGWDNFFIPLVIMAVQALFEII